MTSWESNPSHHLFLTKNGHFSLDLVISPADYMFIKSYPWYLPVIYSWL